jgi:drug/metabolite transporter (DMT)-like permease
MGVIKSNLFTNLIPVYTVVLAYFILGDKLNLRSALGLLITLVGIVVSQIPDIRKLRRGS